MWQGDPVKSAKKNNSIAFRRLCCVAACVVAIGCASVDGSRARATAGSAGTRAVVASPLTAQLLDSDVLASVNSIAIAPPSFGSSASAGALSADEANSVIERIAREKMTLKVVSSQRGKTGLSQEAFAQADAVLRTEILRFDRRQGSAIGGEPAVVSFRMNLEPRGRRSPMWSAQYFLRQEAVSENLLRLGERVGSAGLGAGWNSAQEVFERGVGAALADLNAQRERQFLATGASVMKK